MVMLAGRVCHTLTQIEPLATHMDVILVLQAVAAHKGLHDMAVGAGVVVGTAEASQSGAVERNRLLAAFAVVDDAC